MDINKNYNFSKDEQQISILISIGERLRQSREAIGLSQEDVADCLCLKLSIIKNIEDGCCNIHALKIASIFLYGYIRSYARLVHIYDIETVFSNQQTDKISFSVNTNKKFYVLDLYRQYRTMIIFSVFFVFILFVFLGMFVIMNWYSQNALFKSDYFGVINLRSVRSSHIYEYDQPYLIRHRNFVLDRMFHISFITGLYCIDNIESLLLYFFYDLENIDRSLCNVENYNTRYNLMDGINKTIYSIYEHVLVLSFTSDCWVEVIDASDKILCVGTKYSGDIVKIVGQVPYRLVIGSPRSISIWYQGVCVNIDKFIHSHRVTRLTIPT